MPLPQVIQRSELEGLYEVMETLHGEPFALHWLADFITKHELTNDAQTWASKILAAPRN